MHRPNFFDVVDDFHGTNTVRFRALLEHLQGFNSAVIVFGWNFGLDFVCFCEVVILRELVLYTVLFYILVLRCFGCMTVPSI